MYRWLRCGLIASLLLLWIAPTQSLAYSYGDANTEDVAETFKLIEGALSGASPDWKTVTEAYKTRRSEIKSHFGDEVALTLDKNVEGLEDKLLVANYKAVLVMNLERRFTYASKDVEDYAGAKLLLAKAKATFDTLAPYVTSGVSESNQAFEDALDALGNPGLFGVGKKEADPELFKEKVNFIHTKVKPLFPFKAYVAPAGATQEKPADKPVDKPTPDKEIVRPQQPVPDKPAEEEPKPIGDTVEAPSDNPSDTPESAEDNTEPTADEVTPEMNSESEELSEKEKPAESTQTEPDSSADAQAAEDIAEEASEEHAPMERSDKTNTGITFYVIGGVILLGGGALWFIRKKGLI